ncbi:MAG: VOC family protein [Melioribacteraceae bacterium]
MIKKLHIILYVNDQKRSTDFYKNVLEIEPSLDVPGMTEFELHGGTILGLMPVSGIKKLLGEKIGDPGTPNKNPRAEIYLKVDDPRKYLERALRNGAEELSGLKQRDWGDEAAYCSDPDGYIIAFAKKIEST